MLDVVRRRSNKRVFSHVEWRMLVAAEPLLKNVKFVLPGKMDNEIDFLSVGMV